MNVDKKSHETLLKSHFLCINTTALALAGESSARQAQAADTLGTASRRGSQCLLGRSAAFPRRDRRCARHLHISLTSVAFAGAGRLSDFGLLLCLESV